MTTDCRSNVAEKIRKTLLNIDLQIERAKTEVELRNETMDLTSCSTRKKDLRAFTLAKVEKENYEVFIHRLQEYRSNLVKRVKLVANKYYGKYSNIFIAYFIEQKSINDIAIKEGIEEDKLSKLLFTMQKDLISFVKI